jgi:hypothetical protein
VITVSAAWTFVSSAAAVAVADVTMVSVRSVPRAPGYRREAGAAARFEPPHPSISDRRTSLVAARKAPRSSFA